MESYLLIPFLSTPIHTYSVDNRPDAENLANIGVSFWVFCIIIYVRDFSKICKQTSYVILVSFAKQ
jgi:hypothetical protein